MKFHRHLVTAASLVGATLTFVTPSGAAPIPVGGPAVFEEGIGHWFR